MFEQSRATAIFRRNFMLKGCQWVDLDAFLILNSESNFSKTRFLVAVSRDGRLRESNYLCIFFLKSTRITFSFESIENLVIFTFRIFFGRRTFHFSPIEELNSKKIAFRIEITVVKRRISASFFSFLQKIVKL